MLDPKLCINKQCYKDVQVYSAKNHQKVCIVLKVSQKYLIKHTKLAALQLLQGTKPRFVLPDLAIPLCKAWNYLAVAI